MNRGACVVGRAIFAWAARWRLINHQELQRLLGRVAYMERQLSRCEGKPVFDTFQLAQKIARDRPKNRDRHAKAYACSLCFKFHVGTAGDTVRVVNAARRRARLRQQEADWGGALDA